MGGGIGGSAVCGDAPSTPAGSPRRRRRSPSCEKVATATAAKRRAKAAIAALAVEREWGRESGERKGERDREGGRVRGGGREGGRGGGRKGEGEGEQQFGQTSSNLGKLKFMDSALQKPSQRHPPLFELNYPTESSQRTLHYYCWSTGPIQ